MAYNAKNLSVLAYANGFTLWHYATPDAAHEMAARHYFDAAGDMLRAGDIVLTPRGILLVAYAGNDGAQVSMLAAVVEAAPAEEAA